MSFPAVRRVRAVAGRARRWVIRRRRAGGWPAGPGDGGDRGAALEEARRALEEILVRAVLPFWRERAVDRERGGYHLHHDLAGRDLGPCPRHIIGQSRTLWFFSRLARSPWGKPEDLEAARHGFDFLAGALWDREHGGFFWEAGADGAPVHPHKHALAQAAALHALAAYREASGDERALDLAQRTFEVWDGAAHDPAGGGYVEMHRRDWSGADGLVGYWAADPSLRMLDTQLHAGEGLAALYGVAPSERLAGRVREQIAIVTGRPPEPVQGVVAFTPGWRPLAVHRVEYGFDVKRIVVTVEAGAAVGLAATDHLGLHRRIFASAMRDGWDRRDGGLFEAGRPGRRAHELVKSWWTQAEMLRASLLMWWLTGESRYAAVFLATLRWIRRWQVDWREGGCFELVDHRRRPSGRKAWAWKGPLHLPRALFSCLDALRALPPGESGC